MLERAAAIPYKEMEENFKKQVMEPLVQVVLDKTIVNKKLEN